MAIGIRDRIEVLMSICRCGSVDSWGLVLAMLERSESIHARHDPSGKHGQKGFFDPMPEFDLSSSAVEFIAHIMGGSWGLLDHGSSIQYAWLTDSGKELLEFLREHGTDPEAWPAWSPE